MYAAYYGHGGAVEALLSYGRSDVNAVDNVSFFTARRTTKPTIP